MGVHGERPMLILRRIPWLLALLAVFPYDAIGVAQMRLSSAIKPGQPATANREANVSATAVVTVTALQSGSKLQPAHRQANVPATAVVTAFGVLDQNHDGVVSQDDIVEGWAKAGLGSFAPEKLRVTSEHLAAREVALANTFAAEGQPKSATGSHNRTHMLNSAGQHTGTRAIVDRLLLLFFVLLPIAVFGFIKLVEKRAAAAALLASEGGSTFQSEPEAVVSRMVTRRDSLYRSSGVIDEAGPGPTALITTPRAESSNKDGTLWEDTLSGIVVFLACVPEAISFSFIAGVSPLNGLWAGVFMGMYTSLLGGRPGMISCASAATAVVLVDVSNDPELGVGPMAVCVFICGVMELIVGFFQLGRFVSLVPQPVMLGFANGLAIVIARAQFSQFREHGDGAWVQGPELWGMIATTAIAMGGGVLFPRLPYVGKLVPGPLAAIGMAIIFSIAVQSWLPARSLVMVAGQSTFAGGWNTMPAWNFPPAGVDWHSPLFWSKVPMTGIRMGLVGLVESMLTLKLIDQITETRGSTTRECIAQGLANIVSSFFGVQGGCVLIGQSLINIGSGGRGRLSGFIMGSGLALSVVLLAPVIGMIPVAAFIGIMFLVALNTFVWGSFGLFRVIKWTDTVVILIVTLVTVFVDLAIAVIAGLFFSALVFAWNASKDIKLHELTVDGHTREFRLNGTLFFGSAMAFQSKITTDFPETNVVLDFCHGSVLDHSALDAVHKVDERLRKAGKKVTFRGLPDDAQQYLGTMSSSQDGSSESSH